MEPLEKSAVRLMVYRMVVVLTFFLSALGIQAFLGGESSLQPFYYLIALVLGQNLLYTLLHLFVKPLRDRPLFIYIQITGDILTVTLLAFYTGGINSIFTFLYHVLIVVAGYLLKKRGAFVVAALDCVVYGFLCLALFYDWASPDRLGGTYPYEAPTAGSALYGLLAHYVGFFLVAALMTIMSERIEATRKALGVMEKDFSSLRSLNEQLVSSLTWGVVTMDLRGRVTFSNPAGMRLLGETLPVGWDFEQRLLRLGHKEGPILRPDNLDEQEFEVSLDGDRCLGIVMAPLRSSGAAMGYLALIRDQTEVVRLREQLALKDRLTATGAMAADIAHEIKNPLGSISGAAQMLQRRAPEDRDQGALLRIIQEESRRLGETLDNFLKYVKPAPLRRRRVDMGALVDEVVTLFRNDPACREGLRVDFLSPEDKTELNVDPDKVRQALWNLLQNAKKAVGGTGLVTVSLTAVKDRAILTVEDNGIGMTQSEIAEFFQPFRRGFPQGSGLGLSVVYRIMDQHEGSIVIDSAPGRGTRCRLTFPVDASHE
jgi:two-component system sensor histidine kinase PilS (NtrC family)